MKWEAAPDISERINIIAPKVFPDFDPRMITTLRGFGSTSRAIARIWSFPKPWQLALNLPPQYIIEVVHERFDKLESGEKDKVLIHELMHIPKTFSGALLAHKHHSRNINNRTVEALYKKFLNK